MQLKSRTALALVSAALFVTPSVSGAAPITYNFLDGSVTITASIVGGGPVVFTPNVIDLDGGFVTFDEGPVDMTDFEFTATAQGPVMLTPPLGGYDTFTIDTLTIDPGAGYSTLFVFDGTGPSYSLLVGPIDVVGSATASDSTATLPDMIEPFAFTNSSFNVDITINGGMLTSLDLSGITLGDVALPSGGTLRLKGDIFFTGPVPEPATGLMLAGGLALLALRARKRVH